MNVRAVLLGAALFGGGLLLGAAPTTGQEDAPQSAEQAYMQAGEKMNKEMMKPMSGDADRDFAMMMIAHHQGALDMANVELQYGKDPELRAKAQKIIDDQSAEIDTLQRWLKDHKQVQ